MEKKSITEELKAKLEKMKSIGNPFMNRVAVSIENLMKNKKNYD